MKKEKRGVLLIALGHPLYGKLAYTLAQSLKYTSPDLQICLVFTPSAISHLTADQLDVFNIMKEAPHDCYHRNGNLEYIKAKTWMYKLSPFDTTIFLDVDMIWLPGNPIDKIFDDLSDIDYTIQNRDYVDLASKTLNPKYSQWANVVEIRNAYKFTEGKYYSLHSEFVYFKKSKENKAFFDEWIKQYDFLKVKHTVFAGGIPDELPLAIASVICKKYPHIDKYLPIYWERSEKRKLTRTELIASYFGYSIGGNRITQTQENTYNDMATFYANKVGSRIVFKTKSKINFLSERSNF